MAATAVCAVFAVGIIIAAIAQPDFNRQQPRSAQIFYLLNADTGKAVWASADAQLDQWTSQFFSHDARAAAIKDDLPWVGEKRFLQQQTSTASLLPPEVKLLADENQDQTRSVHLPASQFGPRSCATLHLHRQRYLRSVYQRSATEATTSRVGGGEGLDGHLLGASTRRPRSRAQNEVFRGGEAEGGGSVISITGVERFHNQSQTGQRYSSSLHVYGFHLCQQEFSFPPATHVASNALPTVR